MKDCNAFFSYFYNSIAIISKNYFVMRCTFINVDLWFSFTTFILFVLSIRYFRKHLQFKKKPRLIVNFHK